LALVVTEVSRIFYVVNKFRLTQKSFGGAERLLGQPDFNILSYFWVSKLAEEFWDKLRLYMENLISQPILSYIK